MYMQNGRALQVGRGNNRSLGFYGVAGVGDSFVLPSGSYTSTPDPSVTNQDAVNAYINSGGSDTSAQVDTSTGLPLYVASSSNQNPTKAPVSNTSNTSLLFIVAGVAGLLIMLAGGRR